MTDVCACEDIFSKDVVHLAIKFFEEKGSISVPINLSFAGIFV
jgi:hypothetical protein